MTRNKMTDLNDHLFAQLERLSDEELSAEALEAEIKRAKAVSGIAQQVIANADLGLRAAEFEDRKLDADLRLPPMLGAAVRRKTPEEVAWLLENAPLHAQGETPRRPWHPGCTTGASSRRASTSAGAARASTREGRGYERRLSGLRRAAAGVPVRAARDLRSFPRPVRGRTVVPPMPHRGEVPGHGHRACEEGSAASVGLSGGETERRVGKAEALAPARLQRNHTTSGGEPWPHTITKR